MVFMHKSLFTNMYYFSHTFKSFYIFIPVAATTYFCLELSSFAWHLVSNTETEVDVLRKEVQFLRTVLHVSISVKASGS